MSEIDIAVADSLKVLDLKRLIREADMPTASAYFGSAITGRCRSFRRTDHELVEQCLRFFQIAGVKALGEPAVDRSEEFSGLIPLPLIVP
jgi:hypothetical protein